MRDAGVISAEASLLLVLLLLDYLTGALSLPLVMNNTALPGDRATALTLGT